LSTLFYLEGLTPDTLFLVIKFLYQKDRGEKEKGQVQYLPLH
jgi:hypothetical protein